ncbi:spermidine synthase [Labilibacter sediminis]|nr:spermidine synthase [Labilibacter sediminis]
MSIELQHKELPPRIFNLKGWIQLVDEIELKKLFANILSEAGFTILNESSHQFPLNGFTAFWLLAESHLALHTFTESGWCYVELSSCNTQKADLFKKLTNELNAQIKWESASLEVCSADKGI